MCCLTSVLTYECCLLYSVFFYFLPFYHLLTPPSLFSFIRHAQCSPRCLRNFLVLWAAICQVFQEFMSDFPCTDPGFIFHLYLSAFCPDLISQIHFCLLPSTLCICEWSLYLHLDVPEGRELVLTCWKFIPTIRGPIEETGWGLDSALWRALGWHSTWANYNRNLTV